MQKTTIYLLAIVCFVVHSIHTGAQEPHYYHYDDNNGLPSNEVYSIAQDNRGFIWIACDAGLYKFDGIRYISYRNKEQRSYAVSGLTTTASGRMYCYNFVGQVFYIQNDSMYLLKDQLPFVINLTTNHKNLLCINHAYGSYIYNEKNNAWKRHPQNKYRALLNSPRHTTQIQQGDDTLYYQDSTGIGKITNDKQTVFHKSPVYQNVNLGIFRIEFCKDELWMISLMNNITIRYKNNKTTTISNSNLNKILENRKVTNIKALSDGMLWICTYQGIIQYQPDKDIAKLYYPTLSFSDCTTDREGSYWFSTLQSGIIRVPNLQNLIWNNNNPAINNAKLTKLASNDTNVYAAGVNGEVWQLNTTTQKLTIHKTPYIADIQSFDYDNNDRILYFNINSKIFCLKNNKINITNHNGVAVKALKKAKDYYIFASSHGTSTTHYKSKKAEQTYAVWSRKIDYDSSKKQVWIASNSGVLQMKLINNKWINTDTFLKKQQIRSLQNTGNSLYALSFNGKLYDLYRNREVPITTIPDINTQPNTLKYHSGKIYIATNKGVWIYNITNNNWTSINSNTGLASNNVQDLLIINNILWLATGNGLQSIPLKTTEDTTSAILYLHKLVAGNKVFKTTDYIELNYNQPLILQPEASTYNSNGEYQYAYRVVSIDSTWNYYSSANEQIVIPTLPDGKFTIELIAIDHKKQPSENTIILNGYVQPPVWRTWWFYLLIGFSSAAFVYIVMRIAIKNIRKAAKINTELAQSKLTAIQAQMNPHFIFNALNSIQDLILKGNIEQSYSYITTFSNLVRRTLNYSDKEFIDFEQEIKLLELYLSLEKLRFKNELSYTINTEGIEDITLPPLLIQPFVENALAHGLLHKEGEKRLGITFSLGESLTCTIEDNGIGREKAKAIRERQRNEHESFSGNAIRKRFDILSQSLKGNFGYIYEDIYLGGKAAGTKVTLTIPFKQQF